MLQHGEPVDDAVLLNPRRPNIRCFADCHQSHVTAVRAPGNANFLRISVAGCFHELGRIDFILQITPAQIFIVCLLELGAIAGRSTDVGSNTDVAARNERSDLRAPVIHMLAGWPTVRQDQRRIAAVSFQIKWHPHQRADRLTVEALVMHDLRGWERRSFETGDGRKRELGRAALRDVVNPNVGRIH